MSRLLLIALLLAAIVTVRDSALGQRVVRDAGDESTVRSAPRPVAASARNASGLAVYARRGSRSARAPAGADLQYRAGAELSRHRD